MKLKVTDLNKQRLVHTDFLEDVHKVISSNIKPTGSMPDAKMLNIMLRCHLYKTDGIQVNKLSTVDSE